MTAIANPFARPHRPRSYELETTRFRQRDPTAHGRAPRTEKRQRVIQRRFHDLQRKLKIARRHEGDAQNMCG